MARAIECIALAKNSDRITPHPDPLPSRGEGKRKDKILGHRYSPQSSLFGFLLAAGCIFFFLGAASPALAHRVLVFAYPEGDTIHTESKFAGSGPVQQGEVKVEDRKTGKVLATGATDEKGKYSFKVPPEAAAERLDLMIIVGASLGHQGEWLLKADSYLPKSGAAAPVAPQAAGRAAAAAVAGKVGAVEQQALEEVMNKVMERQLAPIKEMLGDLAVRRRTFPEIIGGLGYIVGIFGVVAYFMSKKKPKE